MKIYGFPTFNLTKVLLTAEEVGQPYELISIDPMKGELKTPENLQRHPLGKMPSLEDNGEFLCESAAMCRYIAVKNGDKLYGSSAMAKAKVDQWMDTLSCHIGRWLQVFYWQEIIKPKYFQQETDKAAVAEAQEWLDQQLPALEKQLGENEFVAGSTISIADTFAFGCFSILEEISLSVADYPNLQRWYETMKARPSFAKVMAAYGA